MENVFIQKAILELKNPTLGTTKQLLEVHAPCLEDGQPKVERVEIDYTETTAAVYFPIENQPFFLAVFFSKTTDNIIAVSTQNGIEVYLTATSETLTFQELSALIALRPLSGWSINDWRKHGKSQYGFSRISFNPFPSKAYELEKKLDLLLSELEKDSEGIKRLAEAAYVIIAVHHQQYINGNKGIHFDVNTISRMQRLNLGIDIDQYVFGHPLKD